MYFLELFNLINARKKHYTIYSDIGLQNMFILRITLHIIVIKTDAAVILEIKVYFS